MVGGIGRGLCVAGRPAFILFAQAYSVQARKVCYRQRRGRIWRGGVGKACRPDSPISGRLGESIHMLRYVQRGLLPMPMQFAYPVSCLPYLHVSFPFVICKKKISHVMYPTIISFIRVPELSDQKGGQRWEPMSRIVGSFGQLG